MPLLRLPPGTGALLAVYAAVLASHGLINHYGIRLVAWLICVMLVMPPNQLAGKTMLGATLGLVLAYLISERRRLEGVHQSGVRTPN
jgi:hypothetical protein